MRGLGLPDAVTPGDLLSMASQYEQLAELQLKVENRQDEVDRREREYARVTQRITSLAEEADLVVEDATPLEQLEALLSERRLQQTRIDHRKKLLERSRTLKEKQLGHAAEIETLGSRRESLFRGAGCVDEEAYRRLASDLAEAAGLRGDRERVTREIAAAIGRLGVEEDFAPMLSAERIGLLDGEWQRLVGEHETIDNELRELLAKRGSLSEQQKLLAEDATITEKRMELGEVETQLVEAKERWRERAAISQMLELIRSDYEVNRQPETLVEASRYMSQLTAGRYTRIWTPLANDILLVDNAEGQSMGVEALSRGTGEQLFLSIRLALVAMYARRGIQLPMVLDDVLVNFDAGRSRTAAKVLIDFAKAGHQLFVFTCHEHVWEMFKDLHADVRRLPSRYEEAVNEEPLEELVEQEVQEIVEVVEPEPEVEEVIEAIVEAPPVVEEPELEPELIEAEYLDLAPRVVEQATIDAVYEELTPPAKGFAETVIERHYDEVAYDHPQGDEAEEQGRYEEVEYYWSDEAEPRDDFEQDEAAGHSFAETEVYAVSRR